MSFIFLSLCNIYCLEKLHAQCFFDHFIRFSRRSGNYFQTSLNVKLINVIFHPLLIPLFLSHVCRFSFICWTLIQMNHTDPALIYDRQDTLKIIQISVRGPRDLVEMHLYALVFEFILLSLISDWFFFFVRSSPCPAISHDRNS